MALEPTMFEPSPDRAERDAAIEAALNQLPGDQREVIVMKIWGELTFAQIGDALEISPNTAASRYRYAIARLEIELSEQVKP
jgi:RNA polymerase sigma-70 factor (ECF subfamily)